MAYPLNVVNPDYEEAPTIPGRLPALAACPLAGPSGQHIHVDVV
jgi:hypothetical protein